MVHVQTCVVQQSLRLGSQYKVASTSGSLYAAILVGCSSLHLADTCVPSHRDMVACRKPDLGNTRQACTTIQRAFSSAPKHGMGLIISRFGANELRSYGLAFRYQHHVKSAHRAISLRVGSANPTHHVIPAEANHDLCCFTSSTEFPDIFYISSSSTSISRRHKSNY